MGPKKKKWEKWVKFGTDLPQDLAIRSSLNLVCEVSCMSYVDIWGCFGGLWGWMMEIFYSPWYHGL